MSINPATSLNPSPSNEMVQITTGYRREEMIRALRWSAIFFVGYLITVQQVMNRSWLTSLDHQIKGIRHHTFRGMSSHILLAVDDLGLRWFTATVLLVAAAIIGWRFKSFRPFNLSLLSLLFLNIIVGISKVIIGRTKPRLHIDLLHGASVGSFPSGHASNALLSWGLLAYLIYRYTHREPFHGINLSWLAVTISVSVCIVSLIRDTHWFSDLLGGMLLGASLLVLIIAIDRSIPSKRQPS
jgi:membrane-associated phospholipid phosphatase